MSVVNDIIAAGEQWQDLLDELNADFLNSETISHRRWVHRVRQIVSVNDRFYAVEYDAPNTEYQEGNELHLKAYEVVPVRKTITAYVPLAKAYNVE